MLGPGHVSTRKPPSGAGRADSGKPGFDAPLAPVASSQPHPTKEKPGPAATPSDPRAPPRRRARCHVTTLPLKHRRNAGRQKAFTPARLGPALPGAGESRSPGGGGGGRAWRRARARHKGFRARRRSARAGGGTIFGARGMGEEQRELQGARRAHSRRPHAPGRSATATPRTGPRGLPPPRSPSRARPPAPRSRSLALARPPFWIGVSSPRAAAAAAFPLFPAPRRCRRRPYSPQLPIRAPPAVDLVSPQKSPVCYSRCGGVVTGWSPGVRERGPRLQRSCNPNPPSGGIFHTPMAPLQTWVRTALCWPRCILPR